MAYDLRDYKREGDTDDMAFWRMRQQIHKDFMERRNKQAEREQLKAEILAEVKTYIDSLLSVQIENAASPVIQDLKKDINSLFTP